MWILVGVYSDSDFDAIGGAIAILSVHGLDEKLYASMQAFEGCKYPTFKKILAIVLWIVLSMTVALAVACQYQSGSLLKLGTCKENEFQCKSGDCIWGGYECNGVEECADGSDEADGGAHCDYESYSCGRSRYCPNGTFFCYEDGSY